MGLRLITAPLTQPISLAEAKAHLRVVDNDEDALISAYIEATTDYVERLLGRALIDQTWELIIDSFPNSTTTNTWNSLNTNSDGAIKIPKPPLIGVTGVFYIGTNGLEATVDPNDYYVDTTSSYDGYGWLVPQGGSLTWPATIDAINAVRIQFRAGYLDTGASPPAENIPRSIVSAMYLIIGALFANREQTVVATIANKLPWGVDELLLRYRIDMSMA